MVLTSEGYRANCIIRKQQMPTYIQLPVLKSTVSFATVNRHLHAFDICSFNGYRTQMCNVIHATSMKIRPTNPTASKYAFDFIFASMNKHAALSTSYWFVHWAGKTDKLFIHKQWDSHGIIYITQAPFDLRNKYGGQRSVAWFDETFDRKAVLLWPTLTYNEIFWFLFD